MILLSAKHLRSSCLMGKLHTKGGSEYRFHGPVFPFEAMVENHPFLLKTCRDCVSSFGPQVLPGIFLGHVLSAARIWKGETMVADTEELEEMDASEPYARRLNAKEVSTPKNGEHFMFPTD